MTTDQLNAIKALCEAAPKGPWEVTSDGYTIRGNDDMPYIAQVHPFDSRKTETVQFIAHTRTDLPACLDEIERLKALCKRESWVLREAMKRKNNKSMIAAVADTLALEQP